MEERFIELGGEKFKIIVNFKNCYRLTKFRNRLETNIDFSNADEEILKEFNSIELNEDGSFPMDKLSLRARKFTLDNLRDSRTIFNMDEIYEIVKILTNVTEGAKIDELLDKEIELNGYDTMVDKLVNGISMVFMKAKDGLQQKEVNKQNLTKVAN